MAKTVTATDAKNRFGEVLAACVEAPVAIERHGRVVAYVVSPREHATAGPDLFERLAAALRGCGARYAAVFGSVADGSAGPGSDIDVAVSVGTPMSTERRAGLIATIAGVAGRAVDLIDLETAQGLILSRALAGREIVCDETATRQRMIRRALRAEDDRRVSARAARVARRSLFT